MAVAQTVLTSVTTNGRFTVSHAVSGVTEAQAIAAAKAVEDAVSRADGDLCSIKLLDNNFDEVSLD